MALDAKELLAAHDSALRDHVPVHPCFGAVAERIGPLILTHYGTHCTVEHPSLDAEAAASAAQLVAQVQTSAGERIEPVEWRVFAHDATTSRLAAALDAAGFTADRERSVLVGEIAELDLPQPAAQWSVKSLRWEEPETQQALALSANSGPHRVPLAAWHAMRRTPYWDIDIRALTHHAEVTAACWLENVSDTEFAVVGGLTTPVPELLAQLPLWRFQRPTKQFLAADADGELRSVLLAARFHEVTTVRSHRWTPPGEPATTPPARNSLSDSQNNQIALRCKARIDFDYASGNGRYTAPPDSRRWFHGMFDTATDPTIAAAERIIQRGLRTCIPHGEWLYQHRPWLNGWEFDPHRVGAPGQPHWPGHTVADHEFQFLTTADARLGTFGHYSEQNLIIFGNALLEQVADDLDDLFGDGTWTFD